MVGEAMNRHLPAVLITITFSVSCATTAFAFDPLGVYIGGAVGEANIKSNESVYGNALALSKHHTAWKLVAGVRPISLVGAEFEYIDFGQVQATTDNGIVQVASNAHPKAQALFGVVYLPLPLPIVNVYGKVGFARLQSSVNASASCTRGIACLLPIGYGPVSTNHTDSRLAYGVGVQAKFSSLAARLEYERISANSGDPDLFSLGVNWTF